MEMYFLLPAQMLQDNVSLAEVSNNIHTWICPVSTDQEKLYLLLFFCLK